MALPITEQENPDTTNIDEVPTLEALRLINEQDKKVARAVEQALPAIAETVERVASALSKGGRLFYVGTGTSGRLGVLDAAELPPTFGVPPELVRGVIAGGYDAVHSATESSEDDRGAGRDDLRKAGLLEKDCVIGIAASGRTPYTIGAVEHAAALGCFTACVTCVPDSPITRVVRVPIVAVVGPEAIAGSTRMKAGTAQKMILNMISTAVMIRLGYVRGNRMTNLKPGNEKLVERSVRILHAEMELEEDAARRLLSECGDDLRVALVVARTGATPEKAVAALEKAEWVVERAVAELGSGS